MSDNLLKRLIDHTGATAGRGSQAHEYHLACPDCGHESSPRDPHCSFSARGWHCFSCGSGGSLAGLADKLNLAADAPYFAPQRPQKAEITRKSVLPYWMSSLQQTSLLGAFWGHSRRFDLWRAYKPLTRELIIRYGLGVGVLPASRCKHERLVIPIFSGTMLVNFRGRAINCQCGKWLAPGGWGDLSMLDYQPLYNADALTSQGAVVFVVENPVDALLLTDNPMPAIAWMTNGKKADRELIESIAMGEWGAAVSRGEPNMVVGVATYSTSYWRDTWTEALLAARPRLVVVAMDNDLPGNGGAYRRSELQREWLKTHPRVPDARGEKLKRRLRKSGLPTVLFNWQDAPNKYDIGSLMEGCASVV